MKIKDRYPNGYMEFSVILAEAIKKADEAKDEWSIKFCADMAERLNKYKAETEVSDAQMEQLQRIQAGKFGTKKSGTTTKKPRPGAVDGRTLAAISAMQGFITRHGEIRPSQITSCVKAADALMEELKK